MTRALTPDTGEEAAVLAALAGARARLGAMAKGPQRGKPVTADAVETLLWACCALAERWQPRRAGHKTGDIGAAQDLTLGSKSVVVDLAQTLVGFADMLDAAEGRKIDKDKVPSFAQAGPEMVKEWRASGGRPLFGAARCFSPGRSFPLVPTVAVRQGRIGVGGQREGRDEQHVSGIACAAHNNELPLGRKREEVRRMHVHASMRRNLDGEGGLVGIPPREHLDHRRRLVEPHVTAELARPPQDRPRLLGREHGLDRLDAAQEQEFGQEDQR